MPKIKSITVYKKDYMLPGMLDNLEQSEGFISSHTVYDNSGNICEEASYHADGSLEHKSLYKHDEKGNITEEIIIGIENEIEERRAFEYDGEGKKIREFYFYLDESFDTINYVYDEKNRLIAKNTVNSENEPENRKIFEYTADRLIREAVLDHEETVLVENTYKYDDAGNLTEHVKNDIPGESYFRMEYEYNEKGRRNLALGYNSEDKLITKESIEEDENGNTIRLIDEDQYKKHTIELAYDDRWNMIEQVELNREGELINKTTRAFDADNNLVEHSVIVDRHGYGLNQNFTLSYAYEYF